MITMNALMIAKIVQYINMNIMENVTIIVQMDFYMTIIIIHLINVNVN